MNEILKVVLSLTASASLLIILLFALRPLYKNRLHKSWQYYIWLVVVLRLLVPFAPETNLVDAVLHRAETPATQMTPGTGDDTNPDTAVYADIQLNEAPASVSSSPLADLRNNLWLAWLLVALVQLVRKVTSFHSFIRFIKASRQPVTDNALLETYALACADIGIVRAPLLYRNKLAVSPMLVGILRPFIVLPDTNLDPEAMRLVLCHELTHLRRQDILYKLLVQLVVCLHWFNPLVYGMAKEIDKTCELSCDESVLHRLDAEEKRRYGNTLLAAIGTGGTYGDTIASLTLNEDARLLKERLEAILLHHGKKPVVVAVASGVFALMLFCVAALAGAYTGTRFEPVADYATAGPAASTETTAVQTRDIPVPDTPSVTAVKAPDIPDTPDFPDMSGMFDIPAFVNSTLSTAKTHVGRSYQSMYFSNKYILTVQWKKNDSLSGYPASARVLSGGVTYTVAFPKETAAYADNADVLSAMSSAIEEINKNITIDGNWSDNFLTLLEVQGPYEGSADELLERFYTEDNTGGFLAVLPQADTATAERLLTRAYDDDQDSYFMFLLSQLPNYNGDALADRAIKDGKDNMLLWLTPHVSDSKREDIIREAIGIGNVATAARLHDDMEETDGIALASLAEDAYNSGNIAMFSLFRDDLDQATASKLAMRAYDDNRVNFFSLLVDDLSEADRQTLLKRAVADGKVSFASILMD